MNRFKTLWLTTMLTFGCASSGGKTGPEGADGAPGDDGAPGMDGVAGADGADGADGVNCWDTNGDGLLSPDEDTNGDGLFNAEDCVPLVDEGDPDVTDDTGEAWVPDRREFTFIDTSYLTTCGLDIDGTIHCWGRAESGLADIPIGSFEHLSMGSHHGCALAADGEVTCWGSNSEGQSTPLAGPFIAVESGQYSSCGIREDGAAECWGGLSYPESHMDEADRFSELSMAGGYSGCGIKLDGTIACWGTEAAINDGAPEGSFSNIENYNGRACAVRDDGVGRCWGNVSSINTDIADYALAASHTCAAHVDGRVSCWNHGVSDDLYGLTEPPDGTFVQIDAENWYVCGVQFDGTVECWGRDSYGEASPP